MFKQDQIHTFLNEITKQDVSEHEKLLNDLQMRIPHSIEVFILGKSEELQVSEFMCFEFAFDMIYSKRYRDVLEYQRGWKIRPIGADKGFFLFLERKNAIQEKPLGDAKHNDLIVYFKDGQPIHAGKIRKNRVRSKWGTGLLLEHEIYEVPELYGNTVRLFEPISLENCIELFIDYAEEQGLQFQIIDD